MTTAIIGGLIITTLLLIGEKVSKKRKNPNILKNKKPMYRLFLVFMWILKIYGVMIHEHVGFRSGLNILLKYKIDILDYYT